MYRSDELELDSSNSVSCFLCVRRRVSGSRSFAIPVFDHLPVHANHSKRFAAQLTRRASHDKSLTCFRLPTLKCSPSVRASKRTRTAVPARLSWESEKATNGKLAPGPVVRRKERQHDEHSQGNR